MSVYLQMQERLLRLHDNCAYDEEGRSACDNCFRQELCSHLTDVAERLSIMKSNRKAPCEADRDDFLELACALDDLFHDLVDL